MRMIGLMMFVIACGDAEQSTETTNAPAKVEAKTEPKADAPKADAAKADAAKPGDKPHAEMNHADHGKAPAAADPGEIPAEAKIYFVEPADGATVKSPFTVKMGIDGMKVQPAGEIVPGTGHHHIVIDSAAIAKGTMVPADDQHKHFGKGQTETELTLAPGEHKIQLQFANGAHLSYGPQLQTEITITVE